MSPPTPAVAGPRPRSSVLWVCCLAQFLVILDGAIVNVALPSIRADLGFSATALPWVISTYTLAFAGFLLLGGRAGDLLGRRPVFVGGLTLLTVASLVGGLAQDPVILLAARAIQGLGSALVAPTSLSILTTTFPEGDERNRALGLWGAIGGLGGASGALIAGLVTETLSWRLVLLINVPIAMGIAATALRAVPARSTTGPSVRSFDLLGAATVTSGLVLLSYGLAITQQQGWTALTTLVPLGAGAMLLALFVGVEARLATAPLVPLRLLAVRAVWASSSIVLCLGATVFTMWYLLTLYLQQVLEYSALQTGLAFAPISLIIMVSTRVASHLTSRVGPGRVLAAGMAAIGVGMLLLARVDATGSWAGDVLGPSLMCALGIGGGLVPATIAAHTGVTADRAGLTSGVLNTANQVGGSLGLAVLGAFVAQHLAGATLGATPTSALTRGLTDAFLAGGCISFSGAVLAFMLLGRQPHR